ncbi:MAG: hypothetical protein NBV60_07035 [Erythrobacter sp.]|nr:hypothetical protein [Erythrobacter sp.]
MTEERITETRTPDGNTHTNTTVITDQPRSGGGAKWVGLTILIVAAAIAILLFSKMNNSEMAKDTAVADAAAEVGAAANQVGNAAEEAVDKIAE